ncbi:antibiotic biosynthesis monooxygenase family protein [Phenylobacterium soli]|uniref:ABM domain-containing protein n=1 Tax=Phenylobacterium soli TaxID=2170551 RepID=A0A328AM95_9CAUL|nr:hypothetical protein [Phenylobacterium soli]RAK54544.1 hypothetical protein DJ017_08420 [Phenylobacterium soli]
MIAILWRYAAAPGAEARFAEVYGPKGDWARLFGRAPGYVRTELLRGADGGFATLDYWDGPESFEAFKAAFGEAYAELDARCEALTEREEKVGVFEVVGG